MSDGKKTVLSLIVAVFCAAGLAVISNALSTRSLEALSFWIVVWEVYVLAAGFRRNGELEWSIGGIFGQLTGWTIPTGISWWVPRPFGQSLRQTSIEIRELDRTKFSGKQLTRVLTSDGAEVEVSYYAIYRIVKLRRWVSVKDAPQAVQTILDRANRWFVNEHTAEEVPKQKLKFSDYLMGKTHLPNSTTGDEEGDKVDKLLMDAVGIELESVKVDDVNLPLEIVEARQKLIAEAAQAEQEQKDIAALGDRTNELAAKTGVDPKTALRAAQAARGDIEHIQVDGDAGDFTKGQTVASSRKRRG